MDMQKENETLMAERNARATFEDTKSRQKENVIINFSFDISHTNL